MREIRTSGSMSGDGKRSVAAWPKLPRPSSTLPKLLDARALVCPEELAKADMRPSIRLLTPNRHRQEDFAAMHSASAVP
jgi:hypothetical protein